MKNAENTSQILLSKKHSYQHMTELRMRSWKNNFDLNYIQTIIAIALNHCIRNNDLIINGYLITSKSLYLIIKTTEKKIEPTINKIEDEVSLLLKKKKHSIDLFIENEEIIYEIEESLFKIHSFKNYYLMKLITGKKVELPYYNRELEALKSMVRHHPFCSAIDCSGAIGPVVVTLLEE